MIQLMNVLTIPLRNERKHCFWERVYYEICVGQWKIRVLFFEKNRCAAACSIKKQREKKKKNIEWNHNFWETWNNTIRDYKVLFFLRFVFRKSQPSVLLPEFETSLNTSRDRIYFKIKCNTCIRRERQTYFCVMSHITRLAEAEDSIWSQIKEKKTLIELSFYCLSWLWW